MGHNYTPLIMLRRNGWLHLDCVFFTLLVGLIATQPFLTVLVDSANVSFLELVEDQIDTESKESIGSFRSTSNAYLAFNADRADSQSYIRLSVRNFRPMTSSGLSSQWQRGPPATTL